MSVSLSVSVHVNEITKKEDEGDPILPRKELCGSRASEDARRNPLRKSSFPFDFSHDTIEMCTAAGCAKKKRFCSRSSCSTPSSGVSRRCRHWEAVAMYLDMP